MQTMESKIVRGAIIVATPTADKSHVALDISVIGSERLRLLLTLPEAKRLFLHLDLATAAIRTAQSAEA